MYSLKWRSMVSLLATMQAGSRNVVRMTKGIEMPSTPME